MTNDQIQLSHLRADFEAMRTRQLRTARRNKELLDNALLALRNGSPAVTDDHVERVIAKLAREIHWLAAQR